MPKVQDALDATRMVTALSAERASLGTQDPKSVSNATRQSSLLEADALNVR